MTQKDIATKLKISRSTYSNYESDFREPDFKNIEILADIFEVSVDYLLGRETSYEQNKTNFIIDGLVKKYDLDLTIKGEREKLEQFIKLYADLRKS